jgi:Trk K+ transport system NAD-binding subunit
VAVARDDVSRLLAAAPVRFVVRSRGTRREFELVSLLRRAGGRFARLSVREDGPLDDVTLAEATVRDRYGVAILAVRDDGRWVVAPRGTQAVRAGDDLYAVGTREALRAFREAVA